MPSPSPDSLPCQTFLTSAPNSRRRTPSANLRRELFLLLPSSSKAPRRIRGKLLRVLVDLCCCLVLGTAVSAFTGELRRGNIHGAAASGLSPAAGRPVLSLDES